MNTVTEFSDSGLLQASYALKFIQRQLVDLSMLCESTVQRQLICPQFFIQLQDKLEKVLHETRSVCCPPPRKPEEGDFEIIKQFSSGSFGSVNLVRHRATRKAFAMKIINWRNLKREQDIRQVLVERAILSYTENEYIVSMFCAFETNRDLRIVMEYVAGGDCASLLEERKRFSTKMSRIYIAETTMALEYLHSYGIIHRDLKPANMLITSTGHIKVADFGLSKIGRLNIAQDVEQAPIMRIVQEITDEETAGTPCYMAPEAILEVGYGKPVDWWALGIILYEFLVGETPFDGTDVDDLCDHVVQDDIIWPEGEAAQGTVAQDLISLLLEKNAKRRLGTGGSGEVKAHPFFKGVYWRFLMDEEPPFIPQLRTEEDTSHFNSSIAQQCQEDRENQEDQDNQGDKENQENQGDQETQVNQEPTVKLPYLCSVAHRFTEVYGSPEHLSAPIPFNQIVVTRLVEEYEEEEDDDEFNYED
ncbi:microtubule-associated serine/threonine-protein kinase 3-like [Scomber japonicus]|uniref:microtubule-associated serine/threonine-protein kinase 3-like n=1 Tax=Scomber japonicus TaxID=13676 RepID=UPI002306D21B|nr:microtubule-associated serine/threonine-protein kinase 3-like [Scomber japonicus]